MQRRLGQDSDALLTGLGHLGASRLSIIEVGKVFDGIPCRMRDRLEYAALNKAARGLVLRKEDAVVVAAAATINGYLLVDVINVNLKNNTLVIDVGAGINKAKI